MSETIAIKTISQAGRDHTASEKYQMVEIFKGMSPMLFACLGVTSVLAIVTLTLMGRPLVSWPFFLVFLFSLIRYFHWRKIDVSTFSLPEIDKAIRFIILSAVINAPLMAGYSIYFMSIIPPESMFIIAGWMAMMACISSISMCSTPTTARGIMLTLLVPSNLVMLSHDQYQLKLFGAVMILMALFCMGSFTTVLKVFNRMKLAARESDEKREEVASALKNFVDMAHDIVWETDKAMKLVYISNAIEDMTGIPARRFIGRDQTEYINLDDAETIVSVKQYRRAIECGEPFQHLILNIVTPDGRNIYADVSGSPICGADGSLTGYRGVITDITRQMKQRNEILKSEERFRDFAELAADCLWETDHEFRYLYISSIIKQWTGHDHTEFIGQKRGSSLDRSSAVEVTDEWNAHLQELADHKPFTNYISKLTTGQVLCTSGKPKFDRDGNFLGYRGYTKEITREYNALEAARAAQAELRTANHALEQRIDERTMDLQQQKNLLQEILDTMGESLVVLSPGLDIVMVNEKPQVPLPPGEWHNGNNALDLYANSPELSAGGADLHDNCTSQNQHVIASLRARKSFRITRLDVSGQHICETFYPRDNGGYVILYSDVTRETRRESELRALSKDLRKSKDLAEQANRAKSEFLANMSHEIRTPMNGVLGMAELLLKSGLSERQQDMAEVIMRSGDSLLTIINDILDFSKLEAGKMTVGSEPFNLRSAVDDVASLVFPKVREKGLDLMIRYQPDLPQNFQGDVGRIRQVITNLVGNAVKFTEDGHILIEISGVRQGDTADLLISVEDTGCGIPDEKLERVFNKFEQVDGSSSRKFEGTGLGLSISRKIVELMGGQISVTSDVGSGSVFSFSLPLQIDRADQNASSGLALNLSEKTVVIADGNPVSVAILKEQLETWSISTVICENADALLHYLAQADKKGDPADAVLLDRTITDQLDDEVAQIAEQVGESCPPIIVLTSESEDSSQSVAFGSVACCLSKPVRATVLLDTLIRVFHTGGIHISEVHGENPGDSDSVARDQSLDGRRWRVLLAEDNIVNQLVLKSMLTELDCDVDTAENGQIALEMFSHQQYDLVLMDVSMPVMDGFQATREMARMRTESGRYVPVIGVTAHAMREDQLRCKSAGMDAYLPKPIKQDRLLAVVRKWLPESGAVTPREKSA